MKTHVKYRGCFMTKKPQGFSGGAGMKINNAHGKALDAITLKLFDPKHYCCMYGGASPCYADFFSQRM